MSSLRTSLLLYNLALPLGLLAMAPGAWKKMRARGADPAHLRQRLGVYPTNVRTRIASVTTHSERLWMHAVSVGEVNVGLKLLQLWLQQHPHGAAILSVTTPTAHDIATRFAERHPQRLAVIYSPFDAPPIVRRVLDDTRPTHIVLVEAEIWPNFVTEAHRRRIPITLVNARLSDRSARRFAKAARLIRPIFSQLSQVLVQEPEDAARWHPLGVPPDRVHTCGSIKFDPEGAAPDPEKIAQLGTLLQNTGITPEQPRLLAASTHAGEELALARLLAQLKTQPRWKDLRLLLVPRHVERTPALLDELAPL
ncbi:MAG: hypothetical protein KDK99_12050, partial [Verrucomicrobiales bacterium]|nr:hypothetical protein [Verrucomicrobiales bacterium]